MTDWRGHVLWFVALLTAAPGCAQDEKRDATESWRRRAAEIAKEYRQWGRVDDQRLRWSPEDCRMPQAGKVRWSASEDGATHGSKLYYVYARYRDAYAYQRPDMGVPGQVLVKAAFVPVAVKSDEQESLLRTAERDGVTYRTGAPHGLFLMFCEPPDVPGTDDGWVYATVDPRGDVTAAGKIASCMECHADAGHGRLFGMDTWPVGLGHPRTLTPAMAVRWDEVKQDVRRRFPAVRQLSIPELERLQAGEAAPLLVDVRPAEEHQVAWIAGARHVPSGKGFVEAFGAEPKDRPIVLYCSVGWRSSQAALELQEAGFTAVHNLEGSIFEWANRGRMLENAGGYTYQVHPYNVQWGELLWPNRRAR